MPRSLLLASTVSLGLLSGFIFVLVILLSIFIGDMSRGLIGAIITTIIINVILWLVSPWISDWMYRLFYKNQWTTLEELAVESPKTAEIIRKICEAEKIKLPKIGIIPDDNPNAFTYGSGPWNARIIITHGIIRFLSDEERSSVVAHELGHIANRDFIIMTIASTLLQILYEIYYYTNKQKKGDSDKKSKLAMIGLVAYIFYWLGSYILLYLSRVREYSADAFSAKYTDANLLADALIKIAMGILSTPSDTRLVKSTRYIGVAGDAVSKQLGLVYKNCEKSGSFELLGRSLLFDLKSPWAFLAELSSTHPLSGKRIGALMKQTLAPKYDLTSIEQRLQIDTNRLYRGFARDFTLVIIARLAPWILGLIIFIGLLVLHIPIEGGFLFVVTGFLVGIVLSMVIKLWMMYPATQDEPTTILEAMGDIYASPVRGRKISLEGQLVGRGIPGYIFSEDMLMQDKTGLIYVDYESRFGWIGNLFYSLKKAAENIGKDVRTSGWFFRDMSSRIVADRITGEGIDLKGGVRLWMLIGIVFMTVVSGMVGVMATNIHQEQKQETKRMMNQINFGQGKKELNEVDLINNPNWKFRDKYDVVEEFKDGIATIVKLNENQNKIGIINAIGNEVIPIGKYNIINHSEGKILAKENNNCKLLNTSGIEVKTFTCGITGSISEGLISVIENDNARVIDTTNGNVKMEAGRYKYIGDFHNGLAEASTESIFSLRKMRKIGFINQEGTLIIPMIYDDDSKNIDFSGGIAVLKKSDKFGVINTKNETIIPFEYEQITAFNNGFAFAQKGEECGAIDEQGKFVSFYNKCTLIESDKNLAIILKLDGEDRVEDELKSMSRENAIVVDITGKEILIHNSLSLENDAIITSSLSGLSKTTKLFNKKGELIIDIPYINFYLQGAWQLFDSKKEKIVGVLYPDGYVKWIK